MKNVIELRQKRASVVTSADAILTRAQEAGRDLTTEEGATFDSLMASLDGFSVAIRAMDPNEGAFPSYNGTGDRAQFARSAKHALSQIVDDPIDADMGGEPVHHTREWAGSMRCERTGQPIRGYQHGERMTERGHHDTPGALGGLVRDLITGEHTTEPEQRDAMVDSDTKGGFLLSPNGAGRIFELARDQSVVSAAGAVTFPMHQRNATMVKVTADPAVSWVPEGGSIASDDSMALGAIDLKMTKLTTRVPITDEMVRFTNGAGLIQQLVTTAMAQEIDRAALLGEGAGAEPTGIMNTDGIQTSAATGNAIDWDGVIDVQTALQNVNAQPNAYIVSPTVNGYISKLKDDYGSYQVAPGSVAQLRKHVTGKASNTTLVMGEWRNLIIAPWSQMHVELVQDVVSGRGKWILQVITYADIACVWPNRFYALTGINS